ncbi:MAG: hypothetical protein Q9214_003592 [Letrouitia sp. 1 TL-2023]
METSESDASPLEQSQPSPREQTFLPLLHDRDFAAKPTLEAVHMAVSTPQTPQTSRTSTEKLPPSQRVASLSFISEACDIPLPASPVSSSSQISDDYPSSTPRSEEGNARSLRSASVAPGSYPDSDMAEDTPRQTPSLTPREQILDAFQSSTESESERNRKMSSCSSETDLLGDREGYIACSISHNQADQTMDMEHTPVEAKTAETSQVEQRERSTGHLASNREHSYIPEMVAEGKPNIESSPTDTRDNGTTALLHSSDDSSHMRLEYDKRRKSSITTSATTTKDGETVSMNENESLAESDAELSSLKPLLASTDKGIASNQTSRRSFEKNGIDDKDVAAVNETVISDQDPSLIRTSTNLPMKNSSASGGSLEVKGQGEASLLPFLKATHESQSSLTAPASPSPPGIAVKEAGDIQAPPLSPQVAPNTITETPQHQQEGKHFVPLGESDELQGPIKLSTNKRKIYLRKARYLVLREPILNVVLGRQIGSQAKLALRRLADGELIVIEPPRSL